VSIYSTIEFLPLSPPSMAMVERTAFSASGLMAAAMPPLGQQDPSAWDGGLAGRVVNRDCSDDPPLRPPYRTELCPTFPITLRRAAVDRAAEVTTRQQFSLNESLSKLNGHWHYNEVDLMDRPYTQSTGHSDSATTFSDIRPRRVGSRSDSGFYYLSYL
jgi:hypothetical protein